jgi:hypothetical protein
MHIFCYPFYYEISTVLYWSLSPSEYFVFVLLTWQALHSCKTLKTATCCDWKNEDNNLPLVISFCQFTSGPSCCRPHVFALWESYTLIVSRLQHKVSCVLIQHWRLLNRSDHLWWLVVIPTLLTMEDTLILIAKILLTPFELLGWNTMIWVAKYVGDTAYTLCIA